MGINLSINQLVVVVISVVGLIGGIFLFYQIISIEKSIIQQPVPGDLVVRVTPAESQKGTLFYINAVNTKDRENNELRLFIHNENETYSVYLYDDGNNYDKKAGDGIYGGYFDSSQRPLGTYNIQNEGETIASFKIVDPKCESIEGNASKSNINFIILPSGYESYDDFKKNAKDLLNAKDSIINVDPFLSNKGKFSFSIANTRDLGCKTDCSNISTIICCDNKLVYEEASKCHYDSIIVLVNSNKHCGSASSYTKICAKNKESSVFLMHEVGHSFADLEDEYVYPDYYAYDANSEGGINCDVQGCDKWKSLTDGCYKGCTYSNLYRPSEKDSVMYDLYPQYNEVCKKHIENVIEDYSSKEKEIENALPEEKSYFINLNYRQGSLRIENIMLKPIKPSTEYKESDYSAKIKDKDGKEIFSTSIYVPSKIYPLPNGSLKRVFEDEFDFSLLLPYSGKAENLDIYYKEKPIESASLAVLSQACGNNACDNSENHISCPKDCSIENDNFCQEASCDPDCPSQKECIIKQKMTYWAAILLVAGALLIILITIIYAMKKRI
jgi:hypothetical protein